MFFKAIAPTCAQRISFTIKIEAGDNGKLAVSVTPISETGKSGFGLTPKQFVATPEEFDNEFSGVMASFATTQQTLAQQLKASELVAEEMSKAAAAAAEEKPKASTSAASKGARVKSSNQAPAGLLEDDGTRDGDGDGDGEEGSDSSKPVTAPAPVVTSGFDFAIEL